MASAWIFQKSEDLRDIGAKDASWYVGWYEPDGRKRKKSFGPGAFGKKNAERFRRKVEAELMTGTYQMNVKKKWEDFRQEYSKKILAGLSPDTRKESETALNHFQRIVKPVLVFTINTGRIDDYIAKRRQEPGQYKGDLVSPATLNKELRHIKAALAEAVEWGYLPKMPRFRMEREPKKLPTFVTPDHFAAIYQACDRAQKPTGQAYTPGDWWRGLLVFAYMTGWRIGEILALKREDLDLNEGTAITRAADNKPNRDDRVKLHPIVVEHLKQLPGFTPTVFPWPQNEVILYRWFRRIQKAAGIDLPCPKNHEHKEACRYYGFHDFRRAFATVNAGRMSADELQKLMRHKSYQTTQRYINMTSRLDEAVANLVVPNVLRGKAANQ